MTVSPMRFSITSMTFFLKRRAVLALASLALAALAPCASAQDVTFTLDPTEYTVTQGQSFFVTGTLQNNTNVQQSATVIQGDVADPTFSYLVAPQAFPVLAAGASFSGTLFTIDTSKNFFSTPTPTPVGDYTSFLTDYVFEDADGNTTTTNTQQITIHVLAPAVPEASTTVSLSLLLAFGLGGVVIAPRRKKTAEKKVA